jgi:uncharacterized SAM-binding protein YcdF (DUF218 family)
MLFLLKKIITFWLMPLPFCLALIIAGWWLLGSARRARCGRRLIAIGIVLLLLFTNKIVSKELLHPLEARYPAIPELRAGEPIPSRLAACRYVVVLGSGHTDMGGLSASAKLSPSGLGRLVEGVRLLRELPAARLIVSGPAFGNHPSHAATLAQSAESLGADPSRILLIETARDTEDESAAVKAIVGDAPVALVTSAWHMPRAAARFRAAGVAFLPCPADFNTRINPEFRWNDLGWDVESLDRSTMAIHEFLGNLWLRLRGKA